MNHEDVQQWYELTPYITAGMCRSLINFLSLTNDLPKDILDVTSLYSYTPHIKVFSMGIFIL